MKYCWITINKTLGVNLQYSSKPPSKKFVRSYFLININEAGPCTGSSLVSNHKPGFFSIYSRKCVISYFVINVNEAGPWTGSALVFNLKPAFFEIYKILLDTDKQKSWRELTVQ